MSSLEIAVFEAKDPDGFAARQARLHAQLREVFDGYLGSIGLRSATEPGVFADLVLWESADAALAAVAALPEREEFSWFHEELRAVRYFGHAEPSADLDVLALLASAPVVELVLVRPADPAAFDAAHVVLHDRYLERVDEVLAHVRLRANADGVAGDVNGWTSADAMQAVAPATMEQPELAPVFDPSNEVIMFMPFTTTVAP